MYLVTGVQTCALPIYRITIEVSGTNAKGFAHITNLDKVNIRNEKTGDSSLSIDEDRKSVV